MLCRGGRSLCILLVVHAASVLSQGGGGCGTTACVRVEHCDPALALLEEKTDRSRQTLRQAFCQFDAQGQATVCCPTLVGSLDNHPSQRLLPADCGLIKGDRIVGGEEALLQEFPWMVLISYRIRGELEFQCGGSLITDRYVLTAAHCISNLGAKTIAGVRVGEHHILTEKDCQGMRPYQICQDHIQDIRVEEIIPHERYSTNKQNRVRNDIGLLRLRRPADLSHKNVGLVCLPTTSALRSAQLSGQDAVVTGWGADDSGRQSHVLRKAKVIVHSDQACSDFWDRGKKSGDETTNKLCAGDQGKDSCSGDSGGPLVVGGLHGGVRRFVQQGVVSYGPKQCGSDFPGVYTAVAPYMKWILDHIRP